TYLINSGAWSVSCTATFGEVSYTLTERLSPPGGVVATVASTGSYSLSNVDVRGNVVVAATVATGAAANCFGALTYGTPPKTMKTLKRTAGCFWWQMCNPAR